jgi:hypothetical protein
VKLLANLDCEARWAGVALPAAVQQRISLYATLFAACATDTAPGERPEIWVPAPIDPARLVAHPGWTPPIVHTAPAPAFDLAWADPTADAANDRAATIAIAADLGVALPGARVIHSLDELDDHIAGLARTAGASAPAPAWICKARWTAAGRDRARGVGPATGELRTRLTRLLARFGPLVFEPWLDRLADLGICGEIHPDADVTLLAPHRQLTDARGGFLGIDVSPLTDPRSDLPADTVDRLRTVAHAAATQLAARTGYRGRFSVDAFTYRTASGPALHPLCELNARHTFGWIAAALSRRLGARQLHFTTPTADGPTISGATVLIAPGADGVVAWYAAR